MQYLLPHSEMLHKTKHNIELWIPKLEREELNVVEVNCERGHYQEYQLKTTTFVYTIVEGKGVFFIDDEPIVVQKGDMVLLPPGHRAWYAGKMKIILSSAPAYKPEDEIHIRFIEEDEVEETWKKYLQ